MTAAISLEDEPERRKNGPDESTPRPFLYAERRVRLERQRGRDTLQDIRYNPLYHPNGEPETCCNTIPCFAIRVPCLNEWQATGWKLQQRLFYRVKFCRERISTFQAIFCRRKASCFFVTIKPARHRRARPQRYRKTTTRPIEEGCCEERTSRAVHAFRMGRTPVLRGIGKVAGKWHSAAPSCIRAVYVVDGTYMPRPPSS